MDTLLVIALLAAGGLVVALRDLSGSALFDTLLTLGGSALGAWAVVPLLFVVAWAATRLAAWRGQAAAG